MNNLRSEVLQAVRRLSRAPGFAIAAILTMSLGISLAGVLFSVINAALLRPPPLRQADQLVRGFTGEANGERLGRTSLPDFLDFRSRTESMLAGLAVSASMPMRLGDSALGTSVSGSLVSGNYFALLGVPVALGRGIAADEEGAPGSHPVVVLSDELWKSHFNADRAIVGKRIAIGGTQFVVVGVASRAFTGTDPGQRAALWVPFTMQAEAAASDYIMQERDARFGNMIGRLRDGVPIANAEQLFARVAGDLAREYPDYNKFRSATLRSMVAARRLEDGPARVLGLALGVVIIIHLIACANLASLMLARGITRSRETAIRLALGATRFRVARQLLLEPLLLSLGAVVAGYLLSAWGAALLQSSPMFAGLDLHLDPIVIAVLGAFGLLTGVIVGLSPALDAGRADVTADLKGTGKSGAGVRESSGNLVIGQLGLAITMLFVASMTGRSLKALLQVEPGYQVEHLLFAHIAQTTGDFRSHEWLSAYQTLLRETRALPGVISVSTTQTIPLNGWGGMRRPITVPGYDYAPNESHDVEFDTIGPDYFRTFGIPLLEGREFDEHDPVTIPETRRIAVVNASMAKRFWPSQSPVGKEIVEVKRPLRIVGVVADAKINSLSEGAVPRYYAMVLYPEFELVIRTSGAPAALVAPVRVVIEQLGPAVAPPRFQTGSDSRAASVSLNRRALQVTSGFASLALLLSTLGLFGVLSLMVQQDRRELGIRLAIGARPASLARLVVARSLRMIGIGIGVGVLGGLGAGQLVSGLLFGVSAADPLGILAACLLLALVGLLATAVPAWRASRTDPMGVLRAD